MDRITALINHEHPVVYAYLSTVIIPNTFFNLIGTFKITSGQHPRAITPDSDSCPIHLISLCFCDLLGTLVKQKRKEYYQQEKK